MRLFALPAALIVILFSPHLSATTYYVATTGNDANAGTQISPFATIQRGVELAHAGDTISVADGTYGPNGHYTCGTVCSQTGYAAPVLFHRSGTATSPITVTAQNKWGAILDCQLPEGYSGDGTDGVQACDTYFDFKGTASYITIENFDITGGYWTGANVNAADSGIQFIGNHFHHIGNRYYPVPAGTSSYGITGVFAGVQSNNITWDGNEFNNIGRLPTPGQIVTDDYSHDHGIYMFGGPHTITNNIFYANFAGWGVQVSPGAHDVAILNNTFAGVNPQQDGLIMLWGDVSDPNINITIRNNIIFGGQNYAIATFGGYENATLIDTNMSFGALIGVIDTTSVIGALTLTNNLFGVDPMFVNAGQEDFHLQPGSPAIDTGASVMVATDFDGNPRPLGPAFDVGAYESTAPPVIPTPAGLAATAVSSSTVSLVWSSVSWTTGVILVEVSSDGVTFTQFTSLPAGNTSCTSTGLTASTQYFFRIRVQYPWGLSLYSNTASAITLPPPLPAAPGQLRVGRSVLSLAPQLNVYWQDNSGDENGFFIFRSQDNVTYTQVATVGSNVFEFDDTSVGVNALYYYYVRAFNAFGMSAPSNTDSGFASAAPPIPAAPGPVTVGQSQAAPTSQLNVYWRNNSNDAAGFGIFRSSDNVSFAQIAAVGASATEYDDAGLTGNTDYYYYVVAFNVSGSSVPSNTDWSCTVASGSACPR